MRLLKFLFRASRRKFISAGFYLALTSMVIAEPLSLGIKGSEISYDLRTRDPIVSIDLSPEGKKQFAKFTQENVGRIIEVRLAGKSIMKAVVREPITGGRFQVNLKSSAEAKAMVEQLSTGMVVEIDTVR